MKITKSLYVLIGALMITGATTTVQAAPTFQHTLGYAGNVAHNRLDDIGAATYVTTDSLQPVHETTMVIYVKSGESVTLVPPGYFDATFTSRFAFRRWYSYDGKNESSAKNLTCSDGFETDKGYVVLDTDNFPTYKSDDKHTYIYCDQSNYTDFSGNSSSSTFIEGTLSQRVIFDIRPAAKMADKWTKLFTTTSPPKPTDKYMEEYNRIAPKDRILYFGPAYQFIGSGDGVYTNYYYKETNGLNNFVSQTITAADRNGNGRKTTITWEWRSSNGDYINLSSNSDNIINNQYIKVDNSNRTIPDEVTYMLSAKVVMEKGTTNWWGYATWKTISTTYYNVAKFKVTYQNPSAYGPIEAPTEAAQLATMKRLAYHDFNTFSMDPDFKKPGTTAPTYYAKHAEWFEASYGFYHDALRSYRGRHNDHDGYSDPTFGDYAFLNNSNCLNADWFAHNVYNHGATGTAEDAKEGYFLYVDGATRPGTAFTIRVNADLCAGITMWFSGYVAKLNTEGESPLLNFAIEGKKASDKEYTPITTYVSGELPIVGKWLHILFPVTIAEETDYDNFRLVITNKGKGARGNDFAIDDIGIYASIPPVTPIQATSATCVKADEDNFTIYMRMEYEDSEDNNVYYQWMDDQKNPKRMEYYGHEQTDGTYGVVTLEKEPTANIFTDFQEFDQYYFEHTEDLPAIGYIKEKDKESGEDEWVLYVATRATLTPRETYLIGAMAGSPASLGSSTCGVFSQLEIKGSMYMTINDESILSGKQIKTCGNRLIHFGVERLILSSNETGMIENRATCSANWLWGTPDYIGKNTDIYGASYDEIKTAIMNGTNRTLLAQLKSKGLYVPRKEHLQVYLSANEATRCLGYTAFPIEGTGYMLDANGNKTSQPVEICPEPIVGEVDLSIVNNENALRIGTKGETVPDIVLANLRTIRVSKAQCDQGFAVPVYSESSSSFTIQAAQLFSTTEQNVETLSLPLSNSTVSPTTQSIALQGGATGTGQLQAGNEYVFALHESNFSEKNCNTGAAYFRVIVVPDQVRWSGSASNVWNNDAGWQTTDGKPAWVPLATTDVILEEGNYRLLSSTAGGALSDEELSMGANPYLQYDINYEPNTCNNIYVPAGAALLNQHLLDITGKPVVEMSVPTNQWTLCAMPVAGCVSGDLWSPAVGESQTDPFTVAIISQTVGASADDRLVNRVWQSLFNKQISNKTTKEDVDVSSSTWTAPLNALTTSYPAGTGVALWVENSNGGNQVTFRLPKTDAAYHYWQANKWHARSETVSRTANGLAYQQDMTIDLQNHDNTGDMFLFGNPTLAYIDMAKLTESNPELAGSWYVLTDNTADLSQELTASVKDVSTDGGDYSLLAPGRAVLLKRQTPDGTLHIRITPEMLTLPESRTALSAPKRAKERARNYALYISATSSGGFTSRAVVQNAWGANDAYRQGEDATVFLMDEWTTPFGIYTISSDHQPLSINLFSDMELIPLACYAQQPIDTLQVRFEGEAGYVGEWHLYDAEEDTRTKLAAGMSLHLAIPTDGKVRYYLEKPADIHPIPTDEPSMEIMPQVQVTGRIGELSVSANTEMERIAVYDVVGRLAATGNAVSSAQWQLPQGVYVVNINIKDVQETSVVLVR